MDEILRATRKVELADGTVGEMAYAIRIDELLRWLARRAEVNQGSKTTTLHGMIEARIIDRKRNSPSTRTNLLTKEK